MLMQRTLALPVGAGQAGWIDSRDIAAMAAKLELVEDQLRATVSEVCKILALKREAEFELKRMKQTYETMDDDEEK